MRALAVLVSTAVLVGLGVAPGHAEKRLALLIGNQGYRGEIARLETPHRDVDLLQRTLSGLGFDVRMVKDAGLATLHQAINAYVRRVEAAGPDAVGFFYYSGHGALDEASGADYLIPVDVSSADAGDLWDGSMRLTEITRKLRNEAGNATHFVVFDACRNALRIKRPGVKALTQSKGWVPIREEAGMLIAFATAEGALASDDASGGAGPYARALADELVKPGIEAVDMFRHVQLRVREAVGQQPWLGLNSIAAVYFAGKANSSSDEAERSWGAVRDTTSIPILEAFIRRYGDSFYADVARARLDELKRVAVVPPPVVPAVPAGPCGRVVALASLSSRSAQPLSRAEECALKPRDAFKECDKCPEIVVVPAGSFTMGSPVGEEGRRNDEAPQPSVTLSTPFAVGRFAVTFEEWDACVADGGCNGYTPADQGRGRRPVINVSWDDAKSYAAWLSRKTGKTYRLPSEAEWEYAARAVTKTPFWWGASISTAQASYDGNLIYGGGSKGEWRQRTGPVETFEPNPWGLYRAQGGVNEWVEDCYHASYAGAPTDGSAWTSGDCGHRVLRGGSWVFNPRSLRPAGRSTDAAHVRNNNGGFRLGRTLTP